jgi:DNA-binding NtrC family response regulator
MDKKPLILLVDDDPGVSASIKVALNGTYDLCHAARAAEGLDLFVREAPDLVLLDVVMPDGNGLTVLKQLREQDPRVPVIMLTATKTVRTAVDAMKMGAADYVTKPFDVEELRLVVARALETQDLTRTVQALRAQVASRYGFHNLIGKSRQMQETYAKIEQIAPVNATVLITGETGTGKELVARAVHYNSPRGNGPFVALNCAALPDTLIETELFGHEKGAFTGAEGRRIGHCELAHKGTLFLDEIGELSLATQGKLLRFLQEKEFMRIGGGNTIKVDVRIVAATNRRLDDLLRAGAFREDLYYRINVAALYLPPLRERREDIPLLAGHFLDAFRQSRASSPTLTKDALDVLMAYHWPGNVRELRNVIEQALAWSSGKPIAPEHLPHALRIESRADANRQDVLAGNVSLDQAVQDFERGIILNVLKRSDYVQTQAAAMLGISRRVLKYRMDALGISSDAQKPLG